MSTHIKYLPAGDYDLRWVPERPARPAGPHPNFIPRTPPQFGPKPPTYPLGPRPGGGIGIPGIGGGLLLGWTVMEFFDSWQSYKEKNPYKIEGGGWYFVRDCGRLPGQPPYMAGGDPNTGPVYGIYLGNFTNCDSGQAVAGHTRWPDPWEPPVVVNVGSAARSLVVADSSRYPGSTARGRNDLWWWKPNTGVSQTFTIRHKPLYHTVRIPRYGDAPNPNAMRGSPGTAPAPSAPPPQPFEWSWNSGPPGSKPPGSSGSRPPKPGSKEKKVRSRINGAAIFEVFDGISENAEVIDAFWESLPDDVKKRWDCNRSAPFIDSAGQYGIDNADCKLRALFYNWDKIDAGIAIMNVAKNLTEDQLYGLLYRHLPPGAMQAMPPETSKAWNKWVEGALELIFLGQ